MSTHITAVTNCDTCMAYVECTAVRNGTDINWHCDDCLE